VCGHEYAFPRNKHDRASGHCGTGADCQSGHGWSAIQADYKHSEFYFFYISKHPASIHAHAISLDHPKQNVPLTRL
jgi:hypothetical protein